VWQQPNVELFQLYFGELREMFFKDFAHGVIDCVYGSAPACGDQLLLTENFDQDRSLG
jgi:hypothetical protein